jgi:hypothetical protein
MNSPNTDIIIYGGENISAFGADAARYSKYSTPDSGISPRKVCAGGG